MNGALMLALSLGGVVKSKVPATVTMIDGEGVQLNLPEAFGWFVGTTVIDETGKPANGAIAGVSCGSRATRRRSRAGS
jgi:hypothetical protein